MNRPMTDGVKMEDGLFVGCNDCVLPKHCDYEGECYRVIFGVPAEFAPNAAELLSVLEEAELVLAEKLRRLGADPEVSPTYRRMVATIRKARGL
jgi:hypothetical protein